jgi:hypothetical protein
MANGMVRAKRACNLQPLESNASKFDSVRIYKKKEKKKEVNMMYLKTSTRNLEIMATLIANLLQTCPIFLTAATHPYK